MSSQAPQKGPEAVQPAEFPAFDQEAEKTPPARAKGSFLPDRPKAEGEGEKGEATFRPDHPREGDSKRTRYVFEPIFLGDRPEDPATRARRLVEEAETEARRLRDEARQELDKARSEAEAIRQQAYQEGYQKGQKDGAEAEKARITAALENLAATLEKLADFKSRMLGAMEEEILALVQAVVDRILLSPQAVAPELVRQAALSAMQRLGEAEKVEIRVHPSDLELLRQFKPELMAAIEGLERLELVADPELKPGDCVAQSTTTQVDATLATRRERVFQALEEALRQGPPLELDEAALEGAAAPADGSDDWDGGDSPDGETQEEAGGDELEDW